MKNQFNATVKSVTANVAKKVITVTLSFPMDDETMKEADALATYVNKMPIGVVWSTKQLSMDALLNEQAAES